MVNYDDEFSALLQDAGHLVPFLDSFFGFLFRRTDFFCLKSDSDPNSKLGFTEGSAEKILLGVFHRWQNHVKNETDNLQKLSSASVPLPVQEVEVEAQPDFQPIPNVSGNFDFKICNHFLLNT
jgi:hypothetical protein